MPTGRLAIIAQYKLWSEEETIDDSNQRGRASEAAIYSIGELFIAAVPSVIRTKIGAIKHVQFAYIQHSKIDKSLCMWNTESVYYMQPNWYEAIGR